jgi:uncharacterized membrane protein YccC
MAKHGSAITQRPGDGPTTSRGETAKGTNRRIARLERKLHRLSGEEARRARRLTRTRERAQAVERRLRQLRTPSGSQPHAYCLRDRRTVAMLDPRPVVVANGRSAVAGTCPVCGGGIVTMVARSAAS